MSALFRRVVLAVLLWLFQWCFSSGVGRKVTAKAREDNKKTTLTKVPKHTAYLVSLLVLPQHLVREEMAQLYSAFSVFLHPAAIH